MLTKYLNQGIVNFGSVFHLYLPFVCGELKKDTRFSGFGKHSYLRFVSQSGYLGLAGCDRSKIGKKAVMGNNQRRE
jgi:hypothetical protein